VRIVVDESPYAARLAATFRSRRASRNVAPVARIRRRLRVEADLASLEQPGATPPLNETVSLSLISHTNVGKTTLARTLLRRDVGEVRDAAHVTGTSDTYLLVASPQG